MKLRFKCACGATLQVDESATGKKITCPRCGQVLTVKEPAPKDPIPVGSTPSRKPTKIAPASPQRGHGIEQYDPFEEIQPSLSLNSTERNSLAGNKVNQGYLSSNSKKSNGTRRIALTLFGTTFGLLCLALIFFLLIPRVLSNRNMITSSFQQTNRPADVVTARKSVPVDSTREASNSSIAIVSGSLGPEATTSDSPIIKIAEQFAATAREGQSGRAVMMLDFDLFDSRQKDSPTGSWDAIMMKLEPRKVLAQIANKSLESTPLDQSFRHWKVLGETTYQGQPAALIRYYSDPEHPQQIIGRSKGIEKLVGLLSFEQFWESSQAVVYNHSKSHSAATPSDPDTYGFLPPRFGYLMLIFDGTKPVDIVNVLGQMPLSQIGGKIYREYWRVIEYGGSDTEYSKRLAKADAVGRKDFSIYGVIPSASDSTSPQYFPTPGLWFRPRNPSQHTSDEVANSAMIDQEWLAKQSPTRTIRLVEIAYALAGAKAECAELVAQFRRSYPDDPGADLAAISFAMTSIEPRLPKPMLPIIEDAALKLYAAFNDPFMLYVQGLVCRARGDEASGSKHFLKANEAGYVSMAMLRFPYEKAIEEQDKKQTLAALREIAAYWSRVPLDRTGDAEEYFRQKWLVAKENGNGAGDFGNRQRVGNLENGPTGNIGPRGVGVPSRPGFAGMPRSTNPNSESGGNASSSPLSKKSSPNEAEFESGNTHARGRNPIQPPREAFGPSTSAQGQGTVNYLIRSKGVFDANVVTSKLKDKLKTGNFQMSSSGDETRIMLGFEGPFDEAVDAVDFGRVVKKDAATRSINVEVP